MGFMDRFKDAANQASTGMGMGTGMGVGDQAAYQQRVMKLNQSGVDTPATVTSVTETGNTDMGGSKELQFDVEVRPAAGTPYAASFKQFMMGAAVEGISAGSEVTVRVDPDDPNSMMYWGGG
jgi:hypothetical protein